MDSPDLGQLPFPVAFPLYWARDPEGKLSASERWENAIFACYQAMRLSALLMLADYLAIDEIAPALASRIRGLRLPHWQEWSLLADELTRFWSAPARSPRFSGVVAGWGSVSRVKHGSKAAPLDPVWTTLIDGFEGLRGQAQARSANEAVWALRNRRAHHEGTATPERERVSQAELEILLPLAGAIVARLFDGQEFVLLRAVRNGSEGPQIIRLEGPHPDLLFAAEAMDPDWEEELRPTEVAALGPAGVIAVYPLLVPTDEDERAGPTGLVEPAMMVHEVSNERLALLGVRDGRTLTRPNPHLQQILAKLASKHADVLFARQQVKPWMVESWARMTAQETVEELVNRKYFPDFYLERPGVDDAVTRYSAQPGKALLLLGDAGSGKSSLIARLADHLIGGRVSDDGPTPRSAVSGAEEGGAVVTYLAGRSDYGGSAGMSAAQLLADRISGKLGVREGAFSSLADLVMHFEAAAREDTEPNRLIWLLLDGLNEADRFTDLVGALDDFLPTLHESERVRLIVSMRSGAFFALSARAAVLGSHGPRVFSHQERFLAYPDSQGKENPWLGVRPFREADEGPKSYALRQQKLPNKASQISYEALSPDLRRLLLTPLYLHLFHTTFAGLATAPGRLDEGELLDAYLGLLTGEGDGAIGGAGAWLARLATVMLRQRRAFLPLAEAEAWKDEWLAANRFSSVQTATKLDPVEELVAASVLLRPAEIGAGSARELIGYQFTQQKLAERLLVQALNRRIAPRQLPSRQELADWAQYAAEDPPFAELTGALRSWVASLARSGEAETLAALLDIAEAGTRTRLIGEAVLACAAAPEAAAKVLNRLATVAAERDDGRERFLLSAEEAANRLDEVAALPARRVVWQAMLEFGQRLAAADPGNAEFQHNLSVLYVRLGDVAVSVGDGAGARIWFEKALAVAERLAAADPGNAGFQSDLSISYDRLGNVAVNAGDGARARTWFEKARAVTERLAAADPSNAEFQRDLSVSYIKSGDLAMSAGDRAGARIWFEKALAVAEHLAGADPGNAEFQRDLSVSYNRLGDLAVSAGDRAGARTWFEKALAVRKSLAGADPGNAGFQRDLSVSYNRLGDLAVNAGDGAAARPWFERALAVRERLAAADPGNAGFQRDLSVSYERLGTLAVDAGDSAAARTWFGKALAVRERLAAADPGNAIFAEDLARSHLNISQFGDAGARHAHLLAAREVLRPFLQSGRQTQRTQSLDALASQRLTELARSVEDPDIGAGFTDE